MIWIRTATDLFGEQRSKLLFTNRGRCDSLSLVQGRTGWNPRRIVHAEACDLSNRKDTGKMIRKLRTAKGLTQEQFAAKVGVTFSTVNRWENGRGTPSPLAMRRIEELRKGFKEQA